MPVFNSLTFPLHFPRLPRISSGGGSHYGPAIELGWEYRLATEVQPLVKTGKASPAHQQKISHGRMSAEEYEEIRPSAQRRNLKSLFLFHNQREYRLKKNQFTDEEIKEAVAEKEKLVKNRERSLRLEQLRVVENWSSVNRSRKIRRAVRNLRKKQRVSNRNEIYNGWWLPLSAHFF